MIEKNMTNEDYHKHPAIGSTTLKTILNNPALAKWRMENEMKPSASIILGQAIHTWFLEPKKFEEEYTLHETKAGNLSLKHDDGDVTTAQYEKFLSMTAGLEQSKEAQEIIENKLLVEASFFVDFEGLKLKVRTDIITKDGYIVDLKTVGGMNDKPCDPDKFCRDFFDRNYDLQMFFYKKIVELATGKKFKGFKFLCIDAKEPVAGVKVYTFVDGESKHFEIGGHKTNEAIKIYKECIKTGVWPVYETVEENDLPLSYNAADYYAKHCEIGEN